MKVTDGMQVRHRSHVEHLDHARAEHDALRREHERHVKEVAETNREIEQVHERAVATVEAMREKILAEHEKAAKARQSQIKKFTAAAAATTRKFLRLPDPPTPPEPDLPEISAPPTLVPEPEPPVFAHEEPPRYTVARVAEDHEDARSGEHFVRLGDGRIAPRGVYLLEHEVTGEVTIVAPADLAHFSKA